MRAEATSTFLHGAARYAVGSLLSDQPDAPAEFIRVDAAELAQFVANGWARDIDAPQPPARALDISGLISGDVVGLTAHPPQAAA